jgi:hypothetical protein
VVILACFPPAIQEMIDTSRRSLRKRSAIHLTVIPVAAPFLHTPCNVSANPLQTPSAQMIRFSMGAKNMAKDIKKVLSGVQGAVKMLRG